MKTSLLLAAAVVAAVAPGAVAVAAPAETVDYVALGDSYAAGFGAGLLVGECRVSGGAYPTLWAATAPAAVTLTQQACSGASTGDVVDKQLGKLSDETDLVTVTAGANDLDLVEATKICSDAGRADACTAKLDAIERGLATTLPKRLAATLAAVKEAAPRATIAVVGYPLPFEDVAQCPGVPLAKSLRDAGNTTLAGVNRVLREQAAAIGATFVDVAQPYAGHGLCSPAPWLVGLEGLSAGTVLHPTRQGQTTGYVATLTAAVGTPAEILERTRPASSSAPVVAAVGRDQSTAGSTAWWLAGGGLVLLVAGVFVYLLLRSRRVRTASR